MRKNCTLTRQICDLLYQNSKTITPYDFAKSSTRCFFIKSYGVIARWFLAAKSQIWWLGSRQKIWSALVKSTRDLGFRAEAYPALKVRLYVSFQILVYENLLLAPYSLEQVVWFQETTPDHRGASAKFSYYENLALAPRWSGLVVKKALDLLQGIWCQDHILVSLNRIFQDQSYAGSLKFQCLTSMTSQILEVQASSA